MSVPVIKCFVIKKLFSTHMNLYIGPCYYFKFFSVHYIEFIQLTF